MKVEYAIIIKNKTRLESLVERFNTQAQAKFYIESSGGNFQNMWMNTKIRSVISGSSDPAFQNH
jgi:hypothetical protein